MDSLLYKISINYTEPACFSFLVFETILLLVQTLQTVSFTIPRKQTQMQRKLVLFALQVACLWTAGFIARSDEGLDRWSLLDTPVLWECKSNSSFQFVLVVNDSVKSTVIASELSKMLQSVPTKSRLWTWWAEGFKDSSVCCMLCFLTSRTTKHWRPPQSQDAKAHQTNQKTT